MQRSDNHSSILKFLGSSTDFPRDAIRSIEEWVVEKKMAGGRGHFRERERGFGGGVCFVLFYF